MNKSWTSYEQIVNKLKGHDQVWIKLSLKPEQVINKAMNKQWTSHEQDMNNSWVSHEQVVLIEKLKYIKASEM